MIGRALLKKKTRPPSSAIEADDAVFIYPDGSLGNKAQDRKDILAELSRPTHGRLRSLQVTVLDADSAFAVGHVIVTNGKYTPPGGKPMAIPGQFRFIDTYVRRNGEWKLVAGANTPVMAPTATASPAMSPSPAAGASPAMKASPATRPSPAVTHTPATKASPATTP